ncbi:MAG: CocE/NonD family hydrolase [Actinomycetota bacterium]|nr:CocE/NonD family hydrolase [Actinomycetota bacterium]
MSFTVEKDIMVPMRDGVRLATDAWVPAGGAPAPALLVRLPYSKDMIGLYAYGVVPNVFTLVEAGYAVVYQDCRGTFRSGGEFTPMLNEAADGVDTVAWLLDQPWCDGNIGTFGASYLGFVQWAAASAGAPLKAIAPALTTTDYYSTPWYSEGGALSLHAIQTWTTMMALAEEQRALGAGAGDPKALMELAGMAADPAAHLAPLPVRVRPALEKQWQWWAEILAHPARDQYWRDLSVADRFEDITVPALNIGGWFDIFVNSTVRSFTGLKSRGGSAAARDGQRLIVGPWDHLNSTGSYPDRQFGMMADAQLADLTGAHQRFYDRWLRGREDALAGSAPVRVFVMGIDQWRDEQDWPLPDTSYADYHLHSSGRANSADGDGELRAEPPAAERADTYLYDPLRPVPTLGGRVMSPSTANAAGPVDQRSAEARQDVLCYSTPVLDHPVEVTGHVSLTVFVSSSAPDTDFTGKLVDVFPDGCAIFLTDGILRARYRNSLAEPEPLTPEQVYEVTLDLSVTSNVFLPGHRIRLEVSSSNFPRFDRNTNTGGAVTEDGDEDVQVAVNRVFHGPAHPSRLVLPVIDR